MTTTPDVTNPLLRELVAVHDMLRRDLRTCRELADAALAGTATGHLRHELDRLASRGPLFQLKTTCMSYCQVVHNHHHREDVTLFTAVRRSAPHLDALVDRLEADHRLVSDILDEVEEATSQLDAVDDTDAVRPADARRRLVDALTSLSDHLLEHLAREEDILAPVFLTWNHWPSE
ncbi:MAG TPA: hemerythrin domain-containing protein [Kineosporiaceae bacterium]|nr:hemerythrin domain-containing protein [Kineosporiaceae bacterium]